MLTSRLFLTEMAIIKAAVPRLQPSESSSHVSPNNGGKVGLDDQSTHLCWPHTGALRPAVFPFQEAQYSSSQSSSNTLSSNASSSAHSDEKWYEVGSRSGVRSDLELSGYLQGASTDSGIDTTSFTATQSSTASSTAAFIPKDKVPWQEQAAEELEAVDTPPPTLDSLVAVGVGETPPKSPSAFPLGPDGSLDDAASDSRYAAALSVPADGSASRFHGTDRSSVPPPANPEVKSAPVWPRKRERGIMK